MTAIVCLRHDLRVHDHPALTAAQAARGPVVPVFCLDRRPLHGRHAAGPRTHPARVPGGLGGLAVATRMLSPAPLECWIVANALVGEATSRGAKRSSSHGVSTACRWAHAAARGRGR